MVVGVGKSCLLRKILRRPATGDLVAGDQKYWVRRPVAATTFFFFLMVNAIILFVTSDHFFIRWRPFFFSHFIQTSYLFQVLTLPFFQWLPATCLVAGEY